jgi:glycosyltransferase involved in cell wall biosynthesis
MHVGVVALRTAQDRGTAADRRLRRHAEALVERGHDVTVYCGQWWGGDLAEFEQNGVRYHAVTVTPASGAFGVKLPIVLARHRPDVLHVAQDPPSQALPARLGGAIARAPVVLEWYDDTPGDGGTRALRAANRVVSPSRLSATDARARGATDETLDVIPEAIDMDLVRNTEPVEAGEIVFWRALDGEANAESLLLGLGELRDRDWEATIIGDGPNRDSVEAAARDIRIEDRVNFVGELPLEATIARLRGAHVFVQTARREPFARNLLWALACGCVGVVQYEEHSAAHELVEGHERGFRTTTDVELAEVLKEAASLEHRRIDEDFASYDRAPVLDQYLECYRRARESFGPL